MRAAGMTSKETAMDNPILVSLKQGRLFRRFIKNIFRGIIDWQPSSHKNYSLLETFYPDYFFHKQLPGHKVFIIRNDDEKVLDELANTTKNEMILFISSRKDLLHKSTLNFGVFGVHYEKDIEPEAIENDLHALGFTRNSNQPDLVKRWYESWTK